MRLLALLGIAAAAYAYLGYYNVAATDSHHRYTLWSLETTMDSSVRRHAGEVGEPLELNDNALVRTGGEHFAAEGCIGCHGGPGAEPDGSPATCARRRPT